MTSDEARREKYYQGIRALRHDGLTEGMIVKHINSEEGRELRAEV